MAIRWDNLAWPSPVNWQHPLARRLSAWWIGVPGRGQGVCWIDLCKNLPAVLTNMTPPSVWSGVTNGRFNPVPGYGLTSLNFTAASSQYALCSTPAFTGLPGTLAVNFRLATLGVPYVLVSVGADTARVQMNTTATPGVVQATTVAADGSAGGAISSTTLITSEYAQAVGVFTSSVLRELYLNGVLEASNSTDKTAGGFTRTVLGARYNSGSPGAFLNGRILDALFWSRALSAQEVRLLRRESLHGYPELLARPGVLVKVPNVAANDAARLINGGPMNHPMFGGLVAAPEF